MIAPIPALCLLANLSTGQLVVTSGQLANQSTNTASALHHINKEGHLLVALYFYYLPIFAYLPRGPLPRPPPEVFPVWLG